MPDSISTSFLLYITSVSFHPLSISASLSLFPPLSLLVSFHNILLLHFSTFLSLPLFLFSFSLFFSILSLSLICERECRPRERARKRKRGNDWRICYRQIYSKVSVSRVLRGQGSVNIPKCSWNSHFLVTPSIRCESRGILTTGWFLLEHAIDRQEELVWN